jgi:type IV secretory pathway TrbL component
MKAILLTGIIVALCGCATTAPPTAWGKPGVSKLDYGTDVGMCTGLAGQVGSGNGANTAGGINGQNSTAQTGTARGSSTASAGASAGSAGGSSSNVPASGTYSGMASADYAQRAATQQRTQEMAAKRAQADAFKNCLTERGYREFTLSPEQRAHLATLKPGSEEYLTYLYTLGADPAVVGAARK